MGRQLAAHRKRKFGRQRHGITVTYNAEKVLEDTIQSIVTQIYKNVEYILVEPYDLSYRFSADFDWCIRIMKKAKVLHNTHLTLIDYLNESMTTHNHEASLKERFRIMAKHYGWAGTVIHHAWFVLRLLYK